MPSPSGILHRWTGDGNAADSVGSNNGTLQNGAGYAAGLAGQAFSLDGINDFVQLSAVGTQPGQTLHGWINMPSTGGNQVVYGQWGNNAIGTAGSLLYISSGFVSYQFSTTGSNFFTAVGSTAITPGTWNHVAATYDGVDAKVYLNGVHEGTLSVAGSLNYPSVAAGIGAIDPAVGWRLFFGGEIDHVEHYSRALTGPEITTLYNGGTPLLCHPNRPSLKSLFAVDNLVPAAPPHLFRPSLKSLFAVDNRVPSAPPHLFRPSLKSLFVVDNTAPPPSGVFYDEGDHKATIFTKAEQQGRVSTATRTGGTSPEINEEVSDSLGQSNAGKHQAEILDDWQA